MTVPLHWSSAAAAAQRDGRALVALESTIITHGMPFPDNLTTARSVEAAARAVGAEPATIAVLGGRLHIGLEAAELDGLAQRKDCRKLSSADLAFALGTGATGSTTVAATMIAARLAGIAVFATGGIGGVHRGAEQDFDVSADLEVLANTAVTVVASGAKAILDLPKTLERLETLGVPVITVGQDSFPAFWSCDSGLGSPLRLDDAAAIAAHHRIRGTLGLPGGTLVANPVDPAHQIPAAVINPVIEAALSEAATQGISGKAVTPYLLRRIYELTDGASLQTNIALIHGNARLAAEIAVALQHSALPKA